MTKFKEGEIAIVVPIEAITPDKTYMQYSGEECMVTRALDTPITVIRDDGSISEQYRYEVELPDGKIAYVQESELKKRRPPGENIHTWANDKINDLIKIDHTIFIEPEEVQEEAIPA